MRISRSIRGSATSFEPSPRSANCTNCSTSRGTPASHSASTITAPERAEFEAGLMMTEEPAASADSTPPAGIATGKFHGGITAMSFCGR